MASVMHSQHTLSQANYSAATAGVMENPLTQAVLAVLAPWTECIGPEAKFHFVVQHEKGSNSFDLLHKENSGGEEPFVLAHFEIRNGKVWLLRNETDTDFAEKLVEQGIPRQAIVLGFLAPEERKVSNYSTGF